MLKGHFKMNHSVKCFKPTPYNSKNVSGTSESVPHENLQMEQTIVM